MMNIRLNTREAAEQLGVTDRTMKAWRADNKGPRYMKIGGRIFYDQTDLDSFIQIVDPNSENQTTSLNAVDRLAERSGQRL